jgi:hypothetical protein
MPQVPISVQDALTNLVSAVHKLIGLLDLRIELTPFWSYHSWVGPEVCDPLRSPQRHLKLDL